MYGSAITDRHFHTETHTQIPSLLEGIFITWLEIWLYFGIC